MGRHAAIIVVEHGNELEPGPERVGVLAQGGHPHVVGVLQLRHGALGDVEPPGECDLAHRLGVAEFVKADLLDGRRAGVCEPFGSAGPGG